MLQVNCSKLRPNKTTIVQRNELPPIEAGQEGRGWSPVRDKPPDKPAEERLGQRASRPRQLIGRFAALRETKKGKRCPAPKIKHAKVIPAGGDVTDGRR